MLLQIEEVPGYLQTLVARRGIEVAASLVRAKGTAMDDEVVFTTPDGSARYPVFVQLGMDLTSFCVVQQDLDASGQVTVTRPGLVHTAFDGLDNIVPELVMRLRDTVPFPVAAAPSPPGR